MQLRRIVSKSSSSPSRAGGLSLSARRKKLRNSISATATRPRRLILESLETRALLTYTYPLGATPNDTAEYMLGDIAVNVVLLESDAGIAPSDNGSLVLSNGTHVTYTPENWTPSAIADVESKVTAGEQWWKDTFTNTFRNAPADSLNFHINFQYA